VEDDITWNLTANGVYSSKSAYEVQFLGSIASNMNKIVWKAWAPRRSSSLLGSSCKIGCGRRTVYKLEVGQIATDAPFATKPSRPLTTSSLCAVLPLGFGVPSRSGLASHPSIQRNGPTSP
jgi:hypothetical protein